MEQKVKPIRSNPNRKPGRQTFTQTKEEKEIVNNKVYEIAQMLSKGISRSTIRREKSQEWGCCEQNIQYYINKALKAMHSSIEKKMEYVLGLQRERLEMVLNGAIEKKDFATAQKVIDTMNKLYGLYEDKKKVSIDTGTIKFDFGNIKTNNEECDE
jgi:hypothetical protein